jgi:N-acetylmuramoyl-L-alanine amidase
MLLTTAMTAANKKFTLVIDAGHGGHDAGAIGAITKEKTINLNVAKVFGRLVERNCPDVKVIYTRKTDIFVALHERADIANRNKADLFISIHTNSLPKRRIARGLETYTLGMHRAADNLDVAKRENAVILIEKDYKQRYQGFDPNSSESYIMFEFIADQNMAQSVELARMVQQRTCSAAGRQDKGVKQAGFLVLRETSMPSCLIELGFISTPDEELFLATDAGVEKLGKGIYQAFLDYKRKYDKNISVPLKAESRQDVNIPQVVPSDVKDQAKNEKKKRKSRMAEELAEAREGKVEEPTAVNDKQTEPDADSILQAAPIIEVTETPTEPAKPSETATTEPAAKTPEPSPAPKQSPSKTDMTGIPVFKVQILASNTRLKLTDSQLKGQKDADCYQDGGMYKYTVGASENYNDIYQLRKQLLARFPEAFIIAFKDNKRTDVQEAIREFKKNRK